LALTGALGFGKVPFGGALCGHPNGYNSFHPWFLVMGHLLKTVRGVGASKPREELEKRRVELDCYFAESRIRFQDPVLGLTELGSLEETFFSFLRRSGPRILETVDALGLISGLALEWKSHASKIYFGVKDSPWQTENVFELFKIYSKVVFSLVRGVTLEAEVKRHLFRGVFEGS